MTAGRDATIKLNVEEETAPAKKTITSIDELSKKLQEATKAGKLLSTSLQSGVKLTTDQTAQLTKQMGSFGNAGQKAFKETTESLTKVRKEFDFTFLTFLFAGMAIQKFGKSILRSLFDTYSMVHNEQGKLNKDILQMKASFGFLKFTIAEALESSPLWNKFKDTVVNMVDSLSDFFTKHPNWSTAVVTAAGALAAIGTLSIVIGTVIQTEMMVAAMATMFGTTIPGVLAGSSTLNSLVKGGLSIGITFFVTKALLDWAGFSNWQSWLGATMGAIVAAGLIFTGLPAGTAAVIAIGIGFTFVGAFKAGEELGDITRDILGMSDDENIIDFTGDIIRNLYLKVRYLFD